MQRFLITPPTGTRLPPERDAGKPARSRNPRVVGRKTPLRVADPPMNDSLLIWEFGSTRCRKRRMNSWPLNLEASVRSRETVALMRGL
jgi:hypothetical protein